MSICVTRMNENVRAILERDHLDCKQKCLTGYLRKNKFLFQDKLPLLKSGCCCRHLQDGRRFDSFTETSPRTNRDISNNNRNSRHLDGDKCPSIIGSDFWISSVQSSCRRGQRLKSPPSTGSEIGETAKHSSSGRKVNRCKIGQKLPIELVVNLNELEKRVPCTLSTTHVSAGNRKYIKDAHTKTHFKKSLLPLLERQETKYVEYKQHNFSAEDNSAKFSSQVLVCYSKPDKDHSPKEKFETNNPYNSVFFNERNYGNVTPKDLMNFKLLRFASKE